MGDGIFLCKEDGCKYQLLEIAINYIDTDQSMAVYESLEDTQKFFKNTTFVCPLSYWRRHFTLVGN